MSAKPFWNGASAYDRHRLGNKEPYDGESPLKELYLTLSSYCATEINTFGNDQYIFKEKEMIKRPVHPWEV